MFNVSCDLQKEHTKRWEEYRNSQWLMDDTSHALDFQNTIFGFKKISIARVVYMDLALRGLS